MLNLKDSIISKYEANMMDSKNDALLIDVEPTGNPTILFN